MGWRGIFKNGLGGVVKELVVERSGNGRVGIVMDYGEVKMMEDWIEYMIWVVDGKGLVLLDGEVVINGENGLV